MAIQFLFYDLNTDFVRFSVINPKFVCHSVGLSLVASAFLGNSPICVQCTTKAHIYLQNCVIYIFMQFLARRGKEGFEDFRLNMFKNANSELLDMTAWVRQFAEQSKNHASDAEDIGNAGQIPYLSLTVSYRIFVFFSPFVYFL